MRAKVIAFVFSALMIIISACTTRVDAIPVKIALLAPFEGIHREIGYNALYAVRLALNDQAKLNINLLAIDDGGDLDSAEDRINAIQNDPTIQAVILIGPYATDATIIQKLTVPGLVIGNWNVYTEQDSAFYLTSRHMNDYLEANAYMLELKTNRVSDLYALNQTPVLMDTTALTIYSSGQLADSDFATRYTQSDRFVPNPNLLTTLVYDATRIIIQHIETQTPLQEIRYEGINGVFTFEGHFWAEAPILEYVYTNQKLKLQSNLTPDHQ